MHNQAHKAKYLELQRVKYTTMFLESEHTLLLMVDIQERLAQAMSPNWSERFQNMLRLAECAQIIGIPALITEQYPDGLGSTLAPLRERLPSAAVLSKVDFDACAAPEISAEIERLESHLPLGDGRAYDTAVILAGVEAHICVFQTARSLVLRGFSVHVPVDAIDARTPEQVEIAKGLLTRCGAIVTSTETVAFDLLKRAGTDNFRSVQKLFKAPFEVKS